MNLVQVVSGFAVGLIVGLTGVGGGSLMTPILLMLGFPPTKAVGTDLLYAAITKAGGVLVHHRQRSIDWRITGWLTLGSAPAAIATVVLLQHWHLSTKVLNNLLTHALGIALLLTAVAILCKPWILRLLRHQPDAPVDLTPRRAVSTVVTGVVIGVLVTLSSIGAGAIGTIALFVLFPMIPTVRLVGTEIAHAVPLTLIAGLGHASMGHLDWSLLMTLLVGSLPGIYIGSRLAGSLSDKTTRPLLAVMLAVIGSKFVFL